MLRRANSSSSFIVATFPTTTSSFLSRRFIFAGPGGLSGGRPRHSANTLVGGNDETYRPSNPYSATRVPTQDPAARQMDPNRVNEEDPRSTMTTRKTPFEMRDANKERGGPGMMFYEEKDTPEFHDDDFAANEEKKRREKTRVQSASERRVHAIRGANHYDVGDEVERERMRKFEDKLEEEFQYLNKKAEAREQESKKRPPGKSLKGSTVEARKKAQETYDYYQMNPDETISRTGMWLCVMFIVGIYFFFEEGKDVTGPLWSGALYPEGRNWEAAIHTADMKDQNLARDAAAHNPLNKKSHNNPLHLQDDVKINDVTTSEEATKTIREKLYQMHHHSGDVLKAVVNDAGVGAKPNERSLNLNLIGAKRVD